MEKIKILVVEDELLIADDICATLIKLGYDVFEPVLNYPQAVKSLRENTPTIAILDVNIPGKKDGIDLAHYINQEYNIPFIFLTSQADKITVDRAKETNPPAYLMKPFNKEDLYTSIEIALANHQKRDTTEEKQSLIVKDALFIRNKDLLKKVKFKDILFLKSDHVYTEIHVKGGTKHLLRGSISSVTEQLPHNFIRIHRSYSVNLDELEAINSHYVIVGDEAVEIPLASNYRTEFMRIIQTK